MRLNPTDLLPLNTVVTIGNKRGNVIDYEIVNAIPSGKIVVHTVLLTEKRKTLIANRFTWIKLDKPETWKGNYSAIEY